MARATKVERAKRGIVLKSGVDGRQKESRREKEVEEGTLGSDHRASACFIYGRNIR